MIHFVAVFQLSGPKSVSENHQHDRPLVLGNLSQVRASLRTRGGDNSLVPDHPETMNHSGSRSMHSDGRASDFDLLSAFLPLKRTVMIIRKYFGHRTRCSTPPLASQFIVDVRASFLTSTESGFDIVSLTIDEMSLTMLLVKWYSQFSLPRPNDPRRCQTLTSGAFC
jgi:hypothetical protein